MIKEFIYEIKFRYLNLHLSWISVSRHGCAGQTKINELIQLYHMSKTQIIAQQNDCYSMRFSALSVYSTFKSSVVASRSRSFTVRTIVLRCRVSPEVPSGIEYIID